MSNEIKQLRLEIEQLKRTLGQVEQIKSITEAFDQNVLYKFKMKQDMAAGGNSDINYLDGGVVKKNVKLKNTIGQFSHLVDTQDGLCIRVGSEFYPIHPEGTSNSTPSNTEVAIFTLTSGITPGSASNANAKVDFTNFVGLAVGDTINVIDRTERYRAYAGSRGIALRVGATWVIIEVDQHPILWTAVLTNNTHDFSVSPGSGTIIGSVANQTTTLVYSNMTARTGYPFSQFESSSEFVNNSYNFIGKIGDTILVSYNSTTNQNHVIDIIPATARQFHFNFTQDRPFSGITGLETITVEGYQAVLGGSGTIPATATARDLYGLAIGAKNGQSGIAVWNFKNAEYNIVACQHTSTIVSGVISASGTSPSAITVGSLVPLNGIAPSSPTIAVTNRFAWPSWAAGQRILVVWDPNSGSWYPLERNQLPPIQLRVSGLNFQVSYDSGSTWTTWATGETCP